MDCKKKKKRKKKTSVYHLRASIRAKSLRHVTVQRQYLSQWRALLTQAVLNSWVVFSSACLSVLFLWVFFFSLSDSCWLLVV